MTAILNRYHISLLTYSIHPALTSWIHAAHLSKPSSESTFWRPTIVFGSFEQCNLLSLCGTFADVLRQFGRCGHLFASHILTTFLSSFSSVFQRHFPNLHRYPRWAVSHRLLLFSYYARQLRRDNGVRDLLQSNAHCLAHGGATRTNCRLRPGLVEITKPCTSEFAPHSYISHVGEYEELLPRYCSP